MLKISRPSDCQLSFSQLGEKPGGGLCRVTGSGPTSNKASRDWERRAWCRGRSCPCGTEEAVPRIRLNHDCGSVCGYESIRVGFDNYINGRWRKSLRRQSVQSIRISLSHSRSVRDRSAARCNSGKPWRGDGWVEVFGHGIFWTHVALKVQSLPEALRVCGEADDTKTVATNMAYGSGDQQSSAPIGKAASLPPAFSPYQARTSSRCSIAVTPMVSPYRDSRWTANKMPRLSAARSA